jgi:hypothetical protein
MSRPRGLHAEGSNGKQLCNDGPRGGRSLADPERPQPLTAGPARFPEAFAARNQAVAG